jgi:Icc-related predicted phosphoesterase
MKIRLLTAADIHQSRHRFEELTNAIKEHRPTAIQVQAFPHGERIAL